MESKTPNIETLLQLYNDSPIAKAFFDYAARRERDQSETKVDRILVRLRADGHEFRRREVIELFRKMQDQGLGQFVEGRHGWPSRFVWSTGLTSVGRAATGEPQILEHISSEDGVVDGSQKDPDRTQVDRSLQTEDSGSRSMERLLLTLFTAKAVQSIFTRHNNQSGPWGKSAIAEAALSISPAEDSYRCARLFNSWSMMRANSLSGCAPESSCPFMTKAGVPCIPRRFASSSSFCTTALNLPLSRHFLKPDESKPSWEA